MNKSDQASAVVSTNPALRKKLPRTVVVLGLVSFFNDFASDIVIPLIPILLAGGAGADRGGRGRRGKSAQAVVRASF